MRKRKPRSLHCSSLREQAEIRARAKAAGKTVTRYVLDLALADDPDRHPLVLTAGWKRIEPVPGACGPGTEVGTMRQTRRRRKILRSLHLSISATDEEWETVWNNAVRHRKSIARYLVGLALGEESDVADSTEPEVALDPAE